MTCSVRTDRQIDEMTNILAKIFNYVCEHIKLVNCNYILLVFAINVVAAV